MTTVAAMSGREYYAINVFRRGDAYRSSHLRSGRRWCKNVLAAGRVILRTWGREVALVEPELIEDRELRAPRSIPRFIERRVAGVDAYLRMRAEAQPRGSRP